ncbi:hypothetical protein [Lewinella sp. IMCC34183]|uniref:hypothetical protein n=1 Tax=Lewinella sp. IMCC34183 TaxID=2248762 RepID=UPI000E2499D3|nr:hypothetical protein [Lewinella sp. IMCC34183]
MKALPLLLLLFAACADGSEMEKNIPGVGAEGNRPPSGAGCYAYAGKGGTVDLYLTDTDGKVTGTLDYALDEKDANTGTFDGRWRGDTLIGEYAFESEGRESVREVAFLKRGDRLIEGYGPQNATGTAFADRSRLAFTSTMPLLRFDCED